MKRLLICICILCVVLAGCKEKGNDNNPTNGIIPEIYDEEDEKAENQEAEDDEKEIEELNSDVSSSTELEISVNKHKTSDIGTFTIPYKPSYVRNGYIIVEDETTGLKGLVDGTGNIIMEVKYPYMEFCGNTELDLLFVMWEEHFIRKMAVYDFDGNQLAIVDAKHRFDVKGFFSNQLISVLSDDETTYLISAHGEVLKEYDSEKNYVRVLNNKYLVATKPLSTGGWSYSIYSATGIYDLEENPIYESDDEMYLIDMKNDYFVLKELSEKTEDRNNWKVLDGQGNTLTEFSTPKSTEDVFPFDDESIIIFEKDENDEEVFAILNLRTLECSDFIFDYLEDAVGGKAFARTIDGRNVIINNEGDILSEIPYIKEDAHDEIAEVKQQAGEGYVYSMMNLEGELIYQDFKYVGMFIPIDKNGSNRYNSAIVEVEDENKEQWYVNYKGETVVTPEEYKRFHEEECYYPLISDDDTILFLVNIIDGEYRYTGYVIDKENLVTNSDEVTDNVQTQSDEMVEEAENTAPAPICEGYANAAEEYYKKYISYIEDNMLYDKVFFFFKDINRDKTVELICGVSEYDTTDGTVREIIYMPEIYTHIDGKVVPLFKAHPSDGTWSWAPYRICTSEEYPGECIISQHISGSGYIADRYYRMGEGLVIDGEDEEEYFLEMLEMDAMMPPDVYYNSVDLSGNIIMNLTETQYNERKESYNVYRYGPPFQMNPDSINSIREGEHGTEFYND